MDLRIKVKDFELDIKNVDVIRFEKTLHAIFAYLDGGKSPFTETYRNTFVDERVINGKNRKTSYVEPIDGVRTYVNGTKEYKCSYNCTCGNRGIRYIHIGAPITTCHKCKGQLTVFPAAENEAHDEEFNYFVAY